MKTRARTCDSRVSRCGDSVGGRIRLVWLLSAGATFGCSPAGHHRPSRRLGGAADPCDLRPAFRRRRPRARRTGHAERQCRARGTRGWRARPAAVVSGWTPSAACSTRRSSGSPRRTRRSKPAEPSSATRSKGNSTPRLRPAPRRSTPSTTTVAAASLAAAASWPPVLPGNVAALYLHGLYNGPVPARHERLGSIGGPRYLEFAMITRSCTHSASCRLARRTTPARDM